jgi:2Fe-2S ferredoxin
MPKLTFLPDRISIEVPPGTSILEAGQKAGAKIGSACGGVCGCSTCHVWVQEGLESLSPQEEGELDILDKAFDVKTVSRLACQAEVSQADVVVQITAESRETFFDEHPNEPRDAEGAQP